MRGMQGRLVLAAGLIALAPRGGAAATRDVANVPTFTLTFGRSVLNQLTFDTYRTPFDELQTRPYNMLFANISRQPNFGAWPGQQEATRATWTRSSATTAPRTWTTTPTPSKGR